MKTQQEAMKIFYIASLLSCIAFGAVLRQLLYTFDADPFIKTNYYLALILTACILAFAQFNILKFQKYLNLIIIAGNEKRSNT